MRRPASDLESFLAGDSEESQETPLLLAAGAFALAVLILALAL